MMIRRLGVLVAFALVITLASSVRADRTYLREADAPGAMFPESTSAEPRTLELSDPERKWLEHTLARRTDVTKYAYFEVRKQSEPVGLIFVLDVTGQSRPITFAVAVAADGALKDVQVMVYREPQGEQIAEPRFRRQFTGKRLTDPIALGRDIDVISGATISARAETYAARKSLALGAIVRARMAAGTNF
jgi:Na+-translocating ferredoxin:NAD+ oxidoreductase RnfG subunit